jgi:hypothetical protein
MLNKLNIHRLTPKTVNDQCPYLLDFLWVIPNNTCLFLLDK